MEVPHYGGMQQQPGPCEHRWRYFVNMENRGVRVRQCEHCAHRVVVPTRMEPLSAVLNPEKRSA